MRNRVITRAMDEVNSLKKDLVSGQLTPEEIVDKCYEYYLKVDLGAALIGQEGERLSDEELVWLNQKESITGYLFSLWMDTSLTVNQEIAEITFSELRNDMTLSEVNDETLGERSEGIHLKGWDSLKERIVSAYFDNKRNIAKAESDGELEEKAFCRGFDEALTFVVKSFGFDDWLKSAPKEECKKRSKAVPNIEL